MDRFDNTDQRAPETSQVDGSVCVVIPVHNEALVVGDVVRGVLERFPFVVCVDDGSHDGSGTVARLAGASVVRHPINLGQGAALRTGIEYALRHSSVEHIVTFDADGQHRVSDAARLLHACREHGVDVVLGSRFLGNEDELPPDRRWLLRLAVAFTRISTGLGVTDTHNGLRVLSRGAAERLRFEQSGMAHASEILTWIARLGLRFIEEPVSIAYSEYSRAKGQSNLNAVNILHELFTARLRVLP